MLYSNKNLSKKSMSAMELNICIWNLMSMTKKLKIDGVDTLEPWGLKQSTNKAKPVSSYSA